MTRPVVWFLFCVFFTAASFAQSDPLPSWNEGATKKAIVAFVQATTKKGGPKFVPPSERIATFDNDGTLWAEQPLYFQLFFALKYQPRLDALYKG
jgi:hypothetical protein